MNTYRSWKIVSVLFSLPTWLISNAVPYLLEAIEAAPLIVQEAVDHIVAFGHSLKVTISATEGTIQPRRGHGAKDHVVMLRSIGSPAAQLNS